MTFSDYQPCEHFPLVFFNSKNILNCFWNAMFERPKRKCHSTVQILKIIPCKYTISRICHCNCKGEREDADIIDMLAQGDNLPHTQSYRERKMCTIATEIYFLEIGYLQFPQSR